MLRLLWVKRVLSTDQYKGVFSTDQIGRQLSIDRQREEAFSILAVYIPLLVINGFMTINKNIVM